MISRYIKKLHNNRLSGESGFTLVELMASLALFSLVAALASTVIFTNMGATERAQINAENQQEANRIIQLMSADHAAGEPMQVPETLSPGTEIKDLTINGTSIDSAENGALSVDYDAPVTINVTVQGADRPDISYTLERTLKPANTTRYIDNS